MLWEKGQSTRVSTVNDLDVLAFRIYYMRLHCVVFGDLAGICLSSHSGSVSHKREQTYCTHAYSLVSEVIFTPSAFTAEL